MIKEIFTHEMHIPYMISTYLISKKWNQIQYSLTLRNTTHFVKLQFFIDNK